jgi:predicted transcriptional regulator
MRNGDGVLSLKLDSREALMVQKALAAEQRVRILGLLSGGPMNVNEIASALSISQPTASVHIRILQNAGLIESELAATDRGSEKRCRIAFRKLVFETAVAQEAVREIVREVPMPIGMFTAVSVKQPCGMASEKNLIGYNDNPESFLRADRAGAQIIWFSEGWVEYTFPTDLPPDAEVTAIEFVCELCSETATYNDHWPSDITVWMNGIEVGTWPSPGDFGGTRGRLNPDWWPDTNTQYGVLKSWIVDESGSKVDGVPATGARLSDLRITYQSPIVVRIGNKPDAAHIGGVNLFGRYFGNYPQDLNLRIRHRLRAPIRIAAG